MNSAQKPIDSASISSGMSKDLPPAANPSTYLMKWMLNQLAFGQNSLLHSCIISEWV